MGEYALNIMKFAEYVGISPQSVLEMTVAGILKLDSSMGYSVEQAELLKALGRKSESSQVMQGNPCSPSWMSVRIGIPDTGEQLKDGCAEPIGRSSGQPLVVSDLGNPDSVSQLKDGCGEPIGGLEVQASHPVAGSGLCNPDDGSRLRSVFDESLGIMLELPEDVNDQTLLTVQEAAGYLGITVDMMTRLVAEGKAVPCIVKGEGKMFRVRDIAHLQEVGALSAVSVGTLCSSLGILESFLKKLCIRGVVRPMYVTKLSTFFDTDTYARLKKYISRSLVELSVDELCSVYHVPETVVQTALSLNLCKYYSEGTGKISILQRGQDVGLWLGLLGRYAFADECGVDSRGLKNWRSTGYLSPVWGQKVRHAFDPLSGGTVNLWYYLPSQVEMGRKAVGFGTLRSLHGVVNMMHSQSPISVDFLRYAVERGAVKPAVYGGWKGDVPFFTGRVTEQEVFSGLLSVGVVAGYFGVSEGVVSGWIKAGLLSVSVWNFGKAYFLWEYLLDLCSFAMYFADGYDYEFDDSELDDALGDMRVGDVSDPGVVTVVNQSDAKPIMESPVLDFSGLVDGVAVSSVAEAGLIRYSPDSLAWYGIPYVTGRQLNADDIQLGLSDAAKYVGVSESRLKYLWLKGKAVAVTSSTQLMFHISGVKHLCESRNRNTVGLGLLRKELKWTEAKICSVMQGLDIYPVYVTPTDSFISREAAGELRDAYTAAKSMCQGMYMEELCQTFNIGVDVVNRILDMGFTGYSLVNGKPYFDGLMLGMDIALWFGLLPEDEFAAECGVSIAMLGVWEDSGYLPPLYSGVMYHLLPRSDGCTTNQVRYYPKKWVSSGKVAAGYKAVWSLGQMAGLVGVSEEALHMAVDRGVVKPDLVRNGKCFFTHRVAKRGVFAGLLTLAGAAKVCGVSEKTVLGWVESGDMRAEVYDGDLPYFTQACLDARTV